MDLIFLSMRSAICLYLALLILEGNFSEAFQNCPSVLTKQTKPLSFTSPDNKIRLKRHIHGLYAYRENSDKFSFAQRVESIKTGVVGLFAGGIALTPVAAIHDIVFPGDSIPGGAAQWEFDTDMGSIQCALFAIVYRYCVREGEDTNEMLGMGVIGAFAVVRTLSRVRVSSYCSYAPLDCGEPLGYFDWDMIQQAAFSGLESAVMFGATAAAMEYCYKRRIISRFE
mmetsp:Transcript_6098/g.7087  ORF Transcript_6098/g.7087 Transcript_6098/m.7087 type:complete len:226 (-) Transcript_6098:119-796(-)